VTHRNTHRKHIGTHIGTHTGTHTGTHKGTHIYTGQMVRDTAKAHRNIFIVYIYAIYLLYIYTWTDGS